MEINIIIPEDLQGNRLDKAVALLLPDHSRTTIQSWLDSGHVLLDGSIPSRRYIVCGGESLRIDAPQPQQQEWEAEDIPLNIIFEDASIIVVDKPAGLVVHPGAGNQSGTLLNALLKHSESLRDLPRAGIVHRLDKNTSGLIVVAKTEPSRLDLIRQFKSREAKREYLAVVNGRLISGGTVEASIGRHPRNRKLMTTGHGKEAVSHYRIVSRYRMHSLVRVSLDTGRTHQIRVHFQHLGMPLVGDPEYGTRSKIPSGASEDLITILKNFRRQALHAESLSVIHPTSKESKQWHTGIPEDMRNLIIALKQDLSESA